MLSRLNKFFGDPKLSFVVGVKFDVHWGLIRNVLGGLIKFSIGNYGFVFLLASAQRQKVTFCDFFCYERENCVRALYPVGNKSASYYPKLGLLLYKMA